MYLSKLQNVFVKIAKCVCHHRYTPSHPLPQYLTFLSLQNTLKLVDRHCDPSPSPSGAEQRDARVQAVHQETVKESQCFVSKEKVN